MIPATAAKAGSETDTDALLNATIDTSTGKAADDAQEWLPVQGPAPAVPFALKGNGSGCCIDVPNGSTGIQIQIWDCVGNTNQRIGSPISASLPTLTAPRQEPRSSSGHATARAARSGHSASTGQSSTARTGWPTTLALRRQPKDPRSSCGHTLVQQTRSGCEGKTTTRGTAELSGRTFEHAANCFLHGPLAPAGTAATSRMLPEPAGERSRRPLPHLRNDAYRSRSPRPRALEAVPSPLHPSAR